MSSGLHVVQAEGSAPVSPILQRCIEYLTTGELLKAQVSADSFTISIMHPSGQTVELTGITPAEVAPPQSSSLMVPCQLAVAASPDRAALAITTRTGISLELVDLASGALTGVVAIPQEFPIQFPITQVRYFRGTDQLAISQVHYKPTGEPEIVTRFVKADGSINPSSYKAFGPPDTEVSASSFDFRDGRVWFLCPAYSARIDRQPRCTLTSASLDDASVPALEIGPPPDDRVIGSGQPNLGFPSSHEIVLLAEKRLWLYDSIKRSFRQLNLPETPQHIRWFEFPGQPKFSSDGLFAAIPIYLSHAPLFAESQVSHGTKLLIVDMTKLEILRTIQPPDKQNVVDFALRNEGKSLTLVASWNKDWQSFEIPSRPGSSAK